jgi:hypothetical protein
LWLERLKVGSVIKLKLGSTQEENSKSNENQFKKNLQKKPVKI